MNGVDGSKAGTDAVIRCAQLGIPLPWLWKSARESEAQMNTRAFYAGPTKLALKGINLAGTGDVVPVPERMGVVQGGLLWNMHEYSRFKASD